VIVLLRKGLELMVVALGTLQRQAQQRRRRDLHGRFQRRVTVDANFLGIAVAFAGAVLPVAEEVGRLQQLNRLGRRDIAWLPGGGAAWPDRPMDSRPGLRQAGARRSRRR